MLRDGTRRDELQKSGEVPLLSPSVRQNSGVEISFSEVQIWQHCNRLCSGKILIFLGVALTIGVKSTLQLFLKRQNFKGSISFAIGLFLVGIGWPIIGMILECYGFVVIFSSWPGLLAYLRKLPVIGWIFWQPSVASFFQPYKLGGRRVPI